jgi:hypothetical protein
MGLPRHLAGAPLVERAVAVAWMASDEGRAFVTASSDRWREEPIAAGEDAERARAAADRTTAAYTGAF